MALMQKDNPTVNPWLGGMGTGLFGNPAPNQAQAAEVQKDVESKIILSGQKPEQAKLNAVNNPSIFDSLLKGTFDTLGGVAGGTANVVGNVAGGMVNFAKNNPDLLTLLGSYAYGRTLGNQMPAIGADLGGALAGSGAAEQITKRQELDKKLNAETAMLLLKANTKENKPLFEVLSQGEKDAIAAFNQADPSFKSVRAKLEKIPKDWGSATAYKVQMSLPTATKEQQQLSTEMTLLTQAIVKSYQGSRPSDRDVAVIQGAVDAIGKGREKAIAALDALQNLADERKKALGSTIAKGYEVDEKKVANILNYGNTAPIKPESNVLPGANQAFANTKSGYKYKVSDVSVKEVK